jgi:DNA-binding transcriptional LysR family regulator
MTDDLSWDDLRIVRAIGRQGSLTATAQALGASHSTLFRRLQRIESSLGVKLFHRTRAGYRPTSAGEDLIRVADGIDKEVGAVRHRLGQREAWPGGVLRVTTTDTLMHKVLPPLLATFHSRVKDVQLQVTTSNALVKIGGEHEADVAIRAGGRPPDPLVGRKLCGLESTIYRSRKLRGISADKLASLQWITVDDSLGHLASARWLEQQGLRQGAALRTNSLVNVLHLARAGLGVAVLPCYLGDLEPGLCRVCPPVKEWSSELWVFTHVDSKKVPRVRQLFDELYAGTREWVALFEGRAPAAGT